MATSSDFLFSLNKEHKNHQKAVIFDHSSQYNNLNLIQSHTHSSDITSSLRSCISISNGVKKNQYDGDNFDNNHFQVTKNDYSKSWNKKTTLAELNNTYYKQEKEVKTDKSKLDNSDKFSINSSTLSLHIAAYENSVEASNVEEVKAKSEHGNVKVGGKTWKGIKKLPFIGSELQNPFEFPRQQEGNEFSDPEVMHFKASQKLLNTGQNSALSSYSLKRELFNLVYEWSIFGGAESIDLETFLKKAKRGYENNYQQWNLLIAGVEKRFIENNYEIFDDDDAQLASLQRSIDPNFCSRPPQLRTRQSKSVAKSASPNFEVNIDGEIQEHPDSPVGANISPLPR